MKTEREVKKGTIRMIKNEIGDNLRRLRKDAGLSQKQMAKALGISAATLCSYETGKTVPSMTVVIKAATIFHVSTDVILNIYSDDMKISEWETNG